MDVASLPTEGTSVKNTFGIDKVYGNIIDGIPGYAIDVNGDFRSKVIDGYSLKNLYDQQTGISGNVGDIEEWQIHRGINETGHYYNWSAYMTGATGFEIVETDLTLVGGAIGATAVFAPGAGKKFYIMWVELSADIAGAAGGQNWKFTFTEETSGNNYGEFYVHSYNMPFRTCIGDGTTGPVGSANDQDLDLAVDLGGGAETIRCRVCGAAF